MQSKSAQWLESPATASIEDHKAFLYKYIITREKLLELINLAFRSYKLLWFKWDSRKNGKQIYGLE